MNRENQTGDILLDMFKIAAATTPTTPHDTPEGPLSGHVVVFTGTLSQPRSKMQDLAASRGARVEAGVNRETTTLVVGVQDLLRTKGQARSTKHRKAEELQHMGQRIQIIDEREFTRLCGMPDGPTRFINPLFEPSIE